MSVVADEEGAWPSTNRASTAAGSSNVRRPRFVPAPLEDEADALLRARRRAPVRRAHWIVRLFRTTAGRALLALLVLAVAAALVFAWIGIRNFFEHDPRFRIDSSASIQTVGNSQLTREELLSIFGSDIGRNIFFVPLAKRQAALEQVPWVQHATVMRLLPDQLRVAVVERTPVAFARVGPKIELVDADGVLLALAPAAMATRHYSFPVLTGLDPAAAPEERRERMHLYQRLIAELDSGGDERSRELSEIDLSGPEDVRVLVPAQGSDLLLHLGQEQFLARYNSYRAHLAEWRQQYPHLASVDLRYDREVVLKMEDGSTGQASGDLQPALTAAPAAAPAKKVAPAHKPASHHPPYSLAHPLTHAKPWRTQAGGPQ